MPFYNNEYQWDYRASLTKGLRNETITPEDNGLILEYLNEKQARDHITIKRVNKIATILVNFRRFMTVPYRAATMGEVYTGISLLMHGNSTWGKPFKQNTLHSYIRIIKPFLLWLIENEYSTLLEKKVSKIKAPPVDRQTTTPDEILSTDEVMSLISACRNSRDRALISALYESGCRIGELARLTWRDILFDKYGARCYITDTKAAKKRYARLIISSQYLAAWRLDCPDSSPDGMVFVNLQTKEPVEYFTLVRLLERITKAAGLKKRVTPHLFRKSRATHMIAQNYQESVIKLSLWGNLSTEMFSTYVCLAEQDIDAEFLDRAGIAQKEAVHNPLVPTPCPQCHEICAPGMDYCCRCGMALTDTAMATLDAMRQSVLENPDILIQLLREKPGLPSK